MKFNSLISRFKSFVVECKRVFRVTKKPSNLEFKTIVKASGFGIIIMGLIGFMVSMIKQLFF